jgi:beta-fructofuranosidase
MGACRWFLRFLLTLLPGLAPCALHAQDKVSAGQFQVIYNPSLGETKLWYINDHTIVPSSSGWHLFGITHWEPAKALEEINFAHATADSLLQPQWEKQPYALSADSANWHETMLWAPHIIFHDSLYYMFYCAGSATSHFAYRIHLATSPDLRTWTRWPENPMFADGFDARDPMVLSIKDTFVMYYTATSDSNGGNHVVAARTSTDLLHWSNRRIVYTDTSTGTFGGPTESPFVVRRGESSYLFIGPRPDYDGTDVFLSKDPFHWEMSAKVGHIGAHAAEVVRDRDGKWYVSRAGWERMGVYLAPLTWNDSLDSAET